MSESNPITEGVRAVVLASDQPAARSPLLFVHLLATLSNESTPITDEALLLLPQEYRRLALLAFTLAMGSDQR